MKARQIRLSSTQEIQRRLKEFTGKKINIVLNNRTVMFGELAMINATRLQFLNMRLKPVSLDLKDVSEVYIDIED